MLFEETKMSNLEWLSLISASDDDNEESEWGNKAPNIQNAPPHAPSPPPSHLN